MSSKTDVNTGSSWDWAKWSMVAFLLALGLGANYFYISQPWPIRLLGWLVLLCIIAALAFQTSKGKQVLEFARESRMELRKVYWPTRQQTTTITIMVCVMVVVFALILWGIDSFLYWLIAWLTGQRG